MHNETKHTAGNWIAKDGQIYPQETGVTLALIPYFEKGNEEQEANQKIIAASKDVLEALENLLENCQHIPKSTFTERGLIVFKKAIQKANEARSKAIHG